jgi:hypothetical protein
MVSMKLLSFTSLCVAAALVLSCSRTQVNPEQEFWNWFKAHEDVLFDFEKDQERIFDQLGDEMHKLNPSLTFEFGPKENGRREFVISADGIREAFPEVEALYATAPSLPRWKFIKFRPRRKPLDVSYGGISVRAASVRVQIEPMGQTADLTVFIPGYTSSAKKEYMTAAFLLLDGALGEYDVETRVGRIRVDSMPKGSVQTNSLDGLPDAFDAALTQK